MKRELQYTIYTRCETLVLIDFVYVRGGMQPVLSADKDNAIRFNNHRVASSLAQGMGASFIVKAVNAKGEGV